MKISTIPRSPETSDKKDCTLVQSSDESKDAIKCESKVNLSGSIKTESKDTGELIRHSRTKKVPCPDTIHEFEEDDGLTMDRVGK